MYLTEKGALSALRDFPTEGRSQGVEVAAIVGRKHLILISRNLLQMQAQYMSSKPAID